MTVYNVGEIYLEDLSGGTSDQLHIYAQTDNIADGAVTDAKLAQTGGVLETVGNTGAALDTLALDLNMRYISGTIGSGGGLIADTSRIRSYLVRIAPGDRITTDGTYAALARVYNTHNATPANYYGSSGAYQTDDIDLTQYAGKYAIVVVNKVGHETEDISADVATLSEHVAYTRVAQAVDEYLALSGSMVAHPLTDDDFCYAVLDADGTITFRTGNPGYDNAITFNIQSGAVSVEPTSDDVMFRVVYYSADGSWVSNGPWYSRSGTATSTAIDHLDIENTNFRLMIASTEQGLERSIPDLLDGFKITYRDWENPIVPFPGYLITPKLAKVGGSYVCRVDPRANFVRQEGGVNVFLSPTGSDSNDGLTVLTPKLTIEDALAVSNATTLIFAEGTYSAGTNFAAGLEIVQPVNLVGIGSVTIDNGSGAPINIYRSVYCENIHFAGGNNSTLIVKLGAYDRTAMFYRCEFSGALANNGISVQGGIAYMIECSAHDNAYDGFNYHMYNSIVNHALEVGCTSYNNGTRNLTGSDGQSSNATTSHDGSYIVRVNGDYRCCHGGIVADKECSSANYGCSAGVSTVTDASYPDRMSNYWSRGASMYLYGCTSYGSRYDTAKVDSGTIVSDVDYTSNYPE